MQTTKYGPWLIGAIWVVVIALVLRMHREVKKDAALEAAVQKTFGPKVGTRGITEIRRIENQLIVDFVVSHPRTEYAEMARGFARDFGELRKLHQDSYDVVVVLRESGKPIMHVRTKPDGSPGPAEDGPPE